ncbi:hypothetical protein FFLO_06777 [Filobasidium floriforme]|uniref:Trafficking protein particle complex subunit n=1 Tax=Filobasidium floriforme TaxID=5210 RepID=A0A8K0JFK7_9TREE|nr:Sybindin-like protein [Filobasidium floriforme]KAG7527598.1 hypothetical protein FFLO_06777 [Filobasidium floriforme]KAH8079022.1 Sybindin-like protein [Filobasidium floriforme]
MVVHGLWIINKAGGLVFQRNYAEGLSSLTANEYLVLAGTLHGVHAITSKLSPTGKGSGVQVIEGEDFKLNIMLTLTGTKFVLITSLPHPNPESTLQKVYEAYSDAVMKNPFYTLEMPINVNGFDERIRTIVASTVG